MIKDNDNNNQMKVKVGWAVQYEQYGTWLHYKSTVA